MPSSRTRRRQRHAGLLLDEHGPDLLAMASTLTMTPARAERLVVDTITAHVHQQPRGPHTTGDERGTLARGVHARWADTHGPRHGDEHDTTLRSRLHDLNDLQLGLVALVLFGGCTAARAGHTLSLAPHEAAAALRDALRALGS
jgi:hypothetical protein